MEIEKLLSIITVNYNGLKDTCELMESLPLNDESLEVIMVDNASKEDEASVIAQRFPQVKVIRSKQNLGFAGGNNLGIQAAHGKYLFFINNDTLLEVKGQRSKDRGQRSKVKGQRSKVKGQRTEVKGQGVEVNDVFQPLIERLESSEKIGMTNRYNTRAIHACHPLPCGTILLVMERRIMDNMTSLILPLMLMAQR